jgi:penicillin amidase
MKIVKKKPLGFSFNNCDSNCWIGVLRFFYLKPKYEGKWALHDETTVYFDGYFVPHIYANNAIGAMTALLIMFTRRQNGINATYCTRTIVFSEELLKNDMFCWSWN